jgi:hypothetical protein
MGDLQRIEDAFKVATKAVSGSPKGIAISIIGVGGKPTYKYLRYIERALDEGTDIFHLLAMGNFRILSAQRLTQRLVKKGRLNVFQRDVMEDVIDGGVMPEIVITLISADCLPKTDPEVWTEDEVGEWERRAHEFSVNLAAADGATG